eukprot:849311-Prorocentrum_lima.AAC.1
MKEGYAQRIHELNEQRQALMDERDALRSRLKQQDDTITGMTQHINEHLGGRGGQDGAHLVRQLAAKDDEI